MNGNITHLVLKIAELCNLNCNYCYMYKHEDHTYLGRPKFMADEVFEQVLLRTKEYCEARSISGGRPYQMFLELHGGEPTLVGARRLDRMSVRANEVLGQHLHSIIMQTNGTLLNASMVDVIRRHNIKVGVSIDGPEVIHDSVRLNHAGVGSHQATVNGIRRLQEAGMPPGLLCVINPEVDGLTTYHHFRSLGANLIGYLFPSVSHDNKEEWYGRFGPTPIADFLIPIFDEWWKEDDPSITVKPFPGLIRAMLGERGVYDSFGNPLLPYLVVESDGSIEGLDVLKVCDEGITASGLNVFEHSFDDLHLGAPLIHQLVQTGIPLCSTCQNCREREVCGGGFIPHRYSKARGFSNPSVWCKDILKLLQHMRNRTQISLSTSPPASNGRLELRPYT